LALKRCWRPDVYDVAGSNQFTCSDDCAARVHKAFSDGQPGPRVLSLQHIPALNCTNRRRRLLKKFDRAHALNVTQSKKFIANLATNATFHTNLQATGTLGQNSPRDRSGAAPTAPPHPKRNALLVTQPRLPSHKATLNRKHETIHVGLSHTRQFWRWYSANPFGFSVSAPFRCWGVSPTTRSPAPLHGRRRRAAIEETSTRHRRATSDNEPALTWRNLSLGCGGVSIRRRPRKV
jgi:hypothetical protein